MVYSYMILNSNVGHRTTRAKRATSCIIELYTRLCLALTRHTEEGRETSSAFPSRSGHSQSSTLASASMQRERSGSVLLTGSASCVTGASSSQRGQIPIALEDNEDGGRISMGPTSPMHCVAYGGGLTRSTMRKPASFMIEAHDVEGIHCSEGGDMFLVAVRGGSKVRARVTDNHDGTYTCNYKPSVSGKYSIAISLLGTPLPGSPFPMEVISPQPHAAKCVVSGNALSAIIARTPHAFEVRYKDAFGLTTTAEELDVFVERIEVEDTPSTNPTVIREGSSQTSAKLPAAETAAAVSAEASSSKPNGGIRPGCSSTADADPDTEKGTSPPQPTTQRSGSHSSRKKSKARQTSFLRQRIEVGSKPLVVRAAFETSSQLYGKLPAGSMLTVLEERVTPEGDLRGRVALLDGTEGGEQIADGWWRPFNATTAFADIVEDFIQSERPLLLTSDDDVDGALSGPMVGEHHVDNTNSATSAQQDGLGEASSGLEVGEYEAEAIISATPAKQDNEVSKQTASKRPKSVRFRENKSHSMMDTRIEMDSEDLSSSGKSPSLKDRAVRAKNAKKDKAKKSDRNTRLSQGEGSSRDGPGSPVRNHGSKGVGWVTLSKGKNELVRRREKLSAGQKQLHLQQWERRLRADKAVTARNIAATPKADDRERTGRQHGTRLVQSPPHIFAQEIASDPDDIGFAYGGVEPGVLHAKGQLHEVHKCTYSVGRAGTYLLHVRLRSQALPIPGSPFRLLVKPDKPHAQSTTLPPHVQQLQGIVGNKETDGCHVLLHCKDKMGNVCDSGGAQVLISCANKSVETICTDNEDGSYSLIWRSVYCGTSEISILIDNAHIIGSPTQMRLISTQPDLSKTNLEGIGLEQAHAGGDTSFLINFVDGYLNTAQPGPEIEVGILLVSEASLKKGVFPDINVAESHPYQSTWVNEGQLEVKYVATVAGGNELHVWCTRKADNNVRVPLPGSPFSLSVYSGKGNLENSEVTSYARDAEAPDKPGGKHNARLLPEYLADPLKIIAGDIVLIRPKILDEFDNPAKLPDGALSVVHKLPNDTSEDIEVLAHTNGGLTTYNIRDTPQLSGTHKVNVLLNSKPIKGSPIHYVVNPDHHECSMSILAAPAKPDGSEHYYTEDTYIVLLTLRDRFGNRCDRGGAVISAKLNYLKQGVHDSTSLTPTNHSVKVEDNSDGTYNILVSVALGTSERALFPASMNVEINLDKDPKEKPTGVNLPSLPLSFVRNPQTETALQTLQRGGKLVQNANHAIKMMSSTGGAPAAAAPAPAAVRSRSVAPSPASAKTNSSKGMELETKPALVEIS